MRSNKIGTDGEVLSWNPGARRLKGYAPEEIIGQRFSNFYTSEDREAGVPAKALKLAREEGRFLAEGWRVRKDGTKFLASVVIRPLNGVAPLVVSASRWWPARVRGDRVVDVAANDQQHLRVGRRNGFKKSAQSVASAFPRAVPRSGVARLHGQRVATPIICMFSKPGNMEGPKTLQFQAPIRVSNGREFRCVRSASCPKATATKRVALSHSAMRTIDMPGAGAACARQAYRNAER
jgi:PAS domain S-box-containing protein